MFDIISEIIWGIIKAIIKAITGNGPEFGRSLMAVSVIVILAYLGSAYLWNEVFPLGLSCAFGRNQPELINQVFDITSGEFLVARNNMLEIHSISYPGQGSQTTIRSESLLYLPDDIELPVERDPREDWVIRSKQLLDQLLEQEVIDDENPVPHVPNIIDVNVLKSRSSFSNMVVGIIVFTDQAYFQACGPQPAREVRTEEKMNDVRIGRPGFLNFFTVEATGYVLTQNDSPNIVEPGVGPVAVIVAVGFLDGMPVTMSDPVVVLRRGAMHPNDLWIDPSQNSAYISGSQFSDEVVPLVAYQSIGPDGRQHVYVSNIFGTKTCDITETKHPDTNNLLDKWGEIDSQGNRRLTYLYPVANNKIPFSVTFDRGFSYCP